MNSPVKADRLARFAEMTSPEREAATLEEMFQRMTCRVEGVEGPQGAAEGLPAICTSWGVPYGRVLTWLMADANRYGVYERALEIAAHALVAETVEIADNDSPATQRDRLRVDTRFRVAKHHAPERYGERIEVHSTERMEVVLERPAIELLKLVRGDSEAAARDLVGIAVDVTNEASDLNKLYDNDGDI